MVNLIFEGIDKSGKTALINAFIKKYPYYRYFHCGESHQNSDKSTHDWYKEYFYRMLPELKHGNCIFDRFLYGELVYGKLYRNYDIDYFEDIEKEIKRYNDTILILVVSNEKTIRKRFDNLGVMKISDIQNVIDLFYDAFKRSLLNKIIIDTSHNNINFCISRIEYKVNKFNFFLGVRCSKCNEVLDNYEEVSLIDYKLSHKKC